MTELDAITADNGRRAVGVRVPDGADRLRLTVHPDHAAALALYRLEGFVPADHDADGELRMTRTIDPIPAPDGSAAD